MATMKRMALVAACCRSGGIGINGDLPWRLRSEMDFFTRITSTVLDKQPGPGGKAKQAAVVMGMRTYQSIPPKFRPLKGRVNVVMSRSAQQVPEGADYLCRSLDEAVKLLTSLEHVDQIYVIGGEEVYRDSLRHPATNLIFLTRIDADFDCDRFFPDIPEEDFEDITHEDQYRNIVLDQYQIPLEVQQEKGLNFKYHLYRRKE